MEEKEQVYQKTEDVHIKKMGMSVLCGLLFGLVAGLVIIVILVVFKQEVMPDAGEPVAKIETTDGGSLSDDSEQNKGKKNNERNGDTLRQHWDNVKRKSIHILGVLQEEDKEKEPGKCSKIL